jgi:hypothetical protein
MIHCIGNSHVNNFSNKVKLDFDDSNSELFRLYRLGAIIAYNYKSSHLSKTLEILQKNYKDGDLFTIVVGEVDCRLHLPQQSDIQNKTDEEIVKECTNRLMECYDMLSEEGYNFFVSGTHPTTTEGHDMSRSDRPIYSDWERRNNICVLWNNFLKQHCEKKNYLFVNIYDELVDGDNKTKMEYFLDYCHLNSSKVFPFIMNELSSKGIV